MVYIARILLCACAVCAWMDIVSADTIHLKSGVVVNGQIVEQDELKVVVDVEGTQIPPASPEQSVMPEQPSPTEEPAPDAQPIEPPSGNPQDAYRSYLRALDSEDWDEIKKYITKANAQAAEQTGDVAAMVQMIKAMGVKDPVVIHAVVQKQQAVLIASGKGLLGEARGNIQLVAEDGVWKVNKEQWKSKTDMRRAAAALAAEEAKKAQEATDEGEEMVEDEAPEEVVPDGPAQADVEEGVKTSAQEESVEETEPALEGQEEAQPKEMTNEEHNEAIAR